MIYPNDFNISFRHLNILPFVANLVIGLMPIAGFKYNVDKFMSGSPWLLTKTFLLVLI
jgi:hypothetical protein